MNTTPSRLADILRAARHSEGLLQREAAERSGVSASAIAKIEQGVYEPKTTTIQKLASAYNTTCAQLLDQAEPGDPDLYLVEVREEGTEWDRWRASLGPSLMLELPHDLAPLMRGPDAAVWVSGQTLAWAKSTPKWIGGSRSPLVVRARAKVVS